MLSSCSELYSSQFPYRCEMIKSQQLTVLTISGYGYSASYGGVRLTLIKWVLCKMSLPAECKLFKVGFTKLFSLEGQV